jgi:uncharacterized membrane protein
MKKLIVLISFVAFSTAAFAKFEPKMSVDQLKQEVSTQLEQKIAPKAILKSAKTAGYNVFDLLVLAGIDPALISDATESGGTIGFSVSRSSSISTTAGRSVSPN